MKKVVKLTERDLANLVKKVISENREPNMYVEGGEEFLSHQLNKIEKGLYELKNFIDKGDKETSDHIIQMLIHNIKLIGV